MFDFTDAFLQQASIHKIGNKAEDEGTQLSADSLDLDGMDLRMLLQRFFLSHFKTEEYYSFDFLEDDLALNPLYNYAKRMFNDGDFHAKTVSIAHYLYEVSNHPMIKPGDLMVGMVKDVDIKGHRTNAIAILKVENMQAFLTLENLKVDATKGINTDKIDKAALIFNTEEKGGYRVLVIDKSNSSDAVFWKDDFLKVKPISDEFSNTKNFLQIAKNFVVEQLPEDFVVDKPKQIDMLNKSLDFFKKHDVFDKEEFENEIFQDKEVIDSFNSFYDKFKESSGLEMQDSFEISTQAVKKQARVFKSVLKLDKNFHIYIHGDRELIEKGTDADGRKYYKIYYTTEE
jgi:37-kD nucleoid-associated bacterial protein